MKNEKSFITSGPDYRKSSEERMESYSGLVE